MLETEVVKRPTRYFAIHFYLLRFLGLGWWHHPDEDDENNFPGLYIYYTIITEIIWVAGFVGLESIDPFIGEKDIDRFMFSLSFVITHDLTIIKLYIFLFKNRAIQDIVRTLEIDIYKFYQNNSRNRATIRITKIMTGSFVFFGWITIGNTNVYGTIQDIRWKAEVAQLNDTSLRPPRTLPQPIYIPWKYQTDASYISTFVLETVGLLWTGHIVMTIDTFIGSVILHMSSQFVILQEAFITSYDRALSQLVTNMPSSNNIADNVSMPIEEDDDDSKDSLDKIEAKVKSFYTADQIEYAVEKTVRECILQHQALIRYVSTFRKNAILS